MKRNIRLKCVKRRESEQRDKLWCLLQEGSQLNDFLLVLQVSLGLTQNSTHINKYFTRQTFLTKKTGFIACDRINFPFFGGIRSSSKFTLRVRLINKTNEIKKWCSFTKLEVILTNYSFLDTFLNRWWGYGSINSKSKFTYQKVFKKKYRSCYISKYQKP